MGRMALLWYGQWVLWFAIVIGIYFWDKKKNTGESN